MLSGAGYPEARPKRSRTRLNDSTASTLKLRVGLNSGEVIVGEIGSGTLGYTAIGEQVGMAQRMESVAPPGGVMLSESTGTACRGCDGAWRATGGAHQGFRRGGHCSAAVANRLTDRPAIFVELGRSSMGDSGDRSDSRSVDRRPRQRYHLWSGRPESARAALSPKRRRWRPAVVCRCFRRTANRMPATFPSVRCPGC